jgi:diadenosine tetraphosphate (Ap4A) HIT family hydrolase
VIPKIHVPTARDFEWIHGDLLAGMFALSKDVARLEGVFDNGYRLAFNVGDHAGMTIFHLHLHLLGGALGPGADAGGSGQTARSRFFAISPWAAAARAGRGASTVRGTRPRPTTCPGA